MSKPLSEEELFIEVCARQLLGEAKNDNDIVLWAVRKDNIHASNYPLDLYYLIDNSDWNHECFFWFRTEEEAKQFKRERQHEDV